MEYVLHIVILVQVYVLLAISLNLISGFTGLLSIGHAAFYGVGAYVAALMALKAQTPFVVNIGCACVVSGLLGALVALPSLRVRDDYFVIVTLVFQAVTFNVLNNWVSLTGGPMGLPGIPRPDILGWTLTSRLDFFVSLLGLCGLSLILLTRLTNSPFGRVLKGIREDEQLTQSLGKNVGRFKVFVFVLGAIIAAVAGVMYAHYITFIDPSSFTIMESIFILTIVIVGGSGNLWGSVLGAAILVVLPEVLRFVGMPTAIAANVRQMLYGVALVAFMMWRPQGLIGEYSFRQGLLGRR